MFKSVCRIPAAVLVLIAAGLAWGPGVMDAVAQTSYRLQTSTMGAAGAPGWSEGRQANGTLSQPTPIGIGSAAGKVLYAGFWPRPWSLASVGERVVADGMLDRLYQNSPNPFRSQTVITYAVSRQSHVEIAVYDVQGRRVVMLVASDHAPGSHMLAWDGRDGGGEVVSPGVYFYRLKTGNHQSSMKMLKLR